jgi:hypothetical protein
MEKAKASGMSESEAENAFNQNMMAGGMLSQGPVEFGEKYKRRWLVTDYEAGDVVFHNSYSVSDKNLSSTELLPRLIRTSRFMPRQLIMTPIVESDWVLIFDLLTRHDLGIQYVHVHSRFIRRVLIKCLRDGQTTSNLVMAFET